MSAQLFDFLKDEVAVSEDSLNFALNYHRRNNIEKLPLILWQCGFISFQQLELICNWFEKNYY